MNTGNHIHYLRRQEIQDAKWDHCLDNARNGLIYGRTFYLDHMTDGQWDALVLDDYKAVMPLTWKRKWGIRYLYQPPFTQQLGIFSGASISCSMIDEFLCLLRKHFRFAEIFLNYGNQHSSLTPRTNFILPLDAPYIQLQGHYKKDLLNNLKASTRTILHYSMEFDLRFALRFYQQLYRERTPHVKPADYERFEALCLFMQDKGQIQVRAITNEKKEPLATALLPVERGRMYLLQSTTSPEGRRTGANHFLLDNIIREFAERPMILDFEGSELPGIAHFYSNFGSCDQAYYFHRHNRLPWPLHLFK